MSILRYFSQSGPPSKRRREMLGDESDDSSDSDNISPSGVSDASQHPGSREADSEGSFRRKSRRISLL